MKPDDLVDDRYRLVRLLGEGGFGTVWLAEETSLDRAVAIKFLRPLDEHSHRRFQREIEALARLSHDHIVKLYRSGTHGGVYYIATEYVDAETLSIWALRPRTVEEILLVVEQIAGALAGAHRAGIVHRDLKPANVMVGAGRDGTPVVKVLDFGIAKLAGPEQLDVTKTGQVIGTPGFMSPEQLRAEPVGPATDLYNLGVILWQLIERRKLFDAESPLETCMQHLREPPPPLSREVPPHIRELVDRLLSKTPGARGRAGDVSGALRGIAPKRHTPNNAASRPEPEYGSGGRSNNLPVILVACTLLGAVALGWMMYSRPSEAPPPRRDAQRASVLVHGVQTHPPDETVADTGTSPTDAAIKSSGGCGISWDGGELLASSPRIDRVSSARLDRSDDRSIIVVPEGYDGHEAVPLVLLLHDGAQPPEVMRQMGTRLVELGAEHQFITVFAEGERLVTPQTVLRSVLGTDALPVAGYPWLHRHVERLPRLLKRLDDAFCIDPDRRFVIGHGQGASGAERLLTLTTAFRAAAMTAHRRKVEGSLELKPGDVVPRMWTVPTGSPALTDDGRLNDCRRGYELESYIQQRDALLALHRCQGDSRELVTTNGVCHTWSCEVPVVSCRTDGGRHWQGYPNMPEPCHGPVSSFDFGGEIWSFFERVSQGP